jgi:CO dehydrogenase maturation factor
MKIAVSGKGGVGKTTVSSNLARLFRREGFQVYAVDADADSSLGLALGIDEGELERVKPMIEMKELIGELAGEGALYTLNPAVDSVLRKYSLDFDGIRFLRMGGVKKGGSSCYCRENTFLKALMNSLIMDTNDVVILDMGAGIEHLTRGTSASVDLMLVVTEPSKASVQTARTVEALAGELGVREVRFIANKIRSGKELAFIEQNFRPDELLGILHYDEAVAERSMGYGKTAQDAIDSNRLKPENQELENLLYKIVRRAKAEQ